MSHSEKLQRNWDFIMKSVIIWDDLAFVSKASASLKRVGCQRDVSACWTIKTCLASGLKQAATAELSLLEAADAHLIVIPSRLAQTFPFHLREWLGQWAALRQIEDAALAAIGDGIHADFTKTVRPELTLLVQRHGLHFIIDEDLVARNATRLITRVPRDGELLLPLSPPRVKYATAHDLFGGFGINE